uniref:Uncharacterized protein n=1 Tax=Parascaris univalens TaxID=6257 RepID=A0A915C4X3_PARUN
MSRAGGPSKAREGHLITLYRTRLLETLVQLTVQTEAAVKAEAEANKYRNRYKRICELLRDAEGLLLQCFIFFRFHWSSFCYYLGQQLTSYLK